MARLFRRLNLFVILSFLIFSFLFSRSLFAQNKAVEIFFFYQQGCPYCAEEKAFLESLNNKYPSLLVREYEVSLNKDNAAVFSLMAQAYDKKIEGTPTIFIDKEMIVGYNQVIKQKIEDKVSYCRQFGCLSPGEKLSNFLKNFDFKESYSEDKAKNVKKNINLIVSWFILLSLVFLIIWGLIKALKKS